MFGCGSARCQGLGTVMCLEVRGKLAGLSPLLLLCGFGVQNCHQAWRQTPLLAEASHCPPNLRKKETDRQTERQRMNK